LKRSSAPPAIYAWLALLLLLWSANFIFARFALRELSIPLVLGFRYVFSAVSMLPVLALGRRNPSWQGQGWTWSGFPSLLAVGLLGLVGNQVLFVIAIGMTSVAHAGVISALSPVLVLVGSAALGHERITPLRAAGLLAAACGVVVLQFSRGTSPGTGVAATRTGDAIMLLSVVVFAAFSLLGKPMAERAGSLRMNMIAYSAAGILALPVALWNMRQGAHASLLAWTGVVYMAVGSSVVGYLIYAHALRYLPASRVSVIVYLQPPLVSLLAIVMLGERPGFAFLPAIALVLTGVYIVERLS
jgi:drug/metabolite transporter (DMT)-like permease